MGTSYLLVEYTIRIDTDRPGWSQVGSGLRTHLPAALELHAKSPQAVEAFKVALTAVVKPPVDAATKAAGDKTVAAMKPAIQESFKSSFQVQSHALPEWSKWGIGAIVLSLTSWRRSSSLSLEHPLHPLGILPRVKSHNQVYNEYWD